MSGLRPGRAAWYALTLVALTNAVSLLDRNILAILAPRIKKSLAIGDAEMGLLYGTVFALFYAIFSLPLGRLADGWVRTRLLGIAVAFWSFAVALAAAAQGFGLLALSRLGVGIGEGATQPAGTSLICDHFPSARRGQAMAVLAASAAIGLGGSSVLGGVATDWWDRLRAAGSVPAGLEGWQFAFLVAALPGFVLAALVSRLPEPRRGQADGIDSAQDAKPFRASLEVLWAVAPVGIWVALARQRAAAREWVLNIGALVLIATVMVLLARVTSHLSPRPALRFGGFGVDPHTLQWSVVGIGAYAVTNLLQRLRHSDGAAYAVMFGAPSLPLCIAVASLQLAINYGIMGFSPSFMMKEYGLSPFSTGLRFGLLSGVIGIIGPLIWGPLSDRASARFPDMGRAYIVLLVLGLSPFLAIWVYGASDPSIFLFRFAIYGLVLTGWYPPLYAMMYDQVLPRMRGITSSTYIVVTTTFGLGIGPFAVGMMADARGGDLGAGILGINWVAPVIVVCLIALARRVHRDTQSMLERARQAGEPV